MTKQVQRRRGTAAQHTSFTGAEGEISVNTTNKSVHVHDGVTAGGVEAARADLTNVSDANLNSALSGNTLSSLTITSADINGGTIDGTVIGGSSPAAGTFSSATVNGNIAVTGTVDGRDVASDGSKLDGIEAGADVTDTANVTSAGALMDSELTDIAAVKALDQGVATTDDPTFTGVDLAAIAASKAVTAVDVFVYDTSRDSDGGAWRKRTQHTSWYNETLNTATRGARREFPAVAVIVAESNKVTIYDGDDPALPMWMVFTPGGSGSNFNFLITGSTRTSCTALNGKLSIGNGTNALLEVSFIDERVQQRYNSGMFFWSVGIVDRNSTPLRLGGTNATAAIASSTVNDVAMTVLPDAPIDPATGLPVPTIAVATAGGVSVIKDDGTVVDSADTTAYINTNFLPDNRFFSIRNNNLVRVDANYFADGFTADATYSVSSTPAMLGATTRVADKAFGSSTGLAILAENQATPANGMVNYITSSFQSGYQVGDIKGAFLSDTDDTDLVGSGELVTNGDFATNDLTGWTDISLGTGSADASTGAAQLTGTDASNRAWINTSFSTVVGKPYVVTFEVTADAGGLVSLGVGETSSSVAIVDFGVSSVGTYTRTFVATTTTTHVNFRTTAVTDMTIDNISVKLADADRSVNNRGLIVNGTVTRTPVATGADLVAYSGFSASNYLTQPYNSALDFGTGDFSVMGWVKATPASRYFLDRSDTGYAGGRISLYRASGGNIRATLTGTADLNSGVELNDTWQFVVLRRANGVLYLSVNNSTPATAANTSNLSNTSAILRFGISVLGQFQNQSMALWRISATAPTAEQIAKIYNDEKFLFQDNAQATLYGASDAVTALAHDPVFDLLHVGTSAGRSVFSGLRRVSNTTTAVGTAISASNGLVAEE